MNCKAPPQSVLAPPRYVLPSIAQQDIVMSRTKSRHTSTYHTTSLSCCGAVIDCHRVSVLSLIVENQANCFELVFLSYNSAA